MRRSWLMGVLFELFGVNIPSTPELSMGWVDPSVGLGRNFSVYGGLGWVGSTTAKVLKI